MRLITPEVREKRSCAECLAVVPAILAIVKVIRGR